MDPKNLVPSVSALVLTGGASTRFGDDKISAILAGRRMIDHVLAAIPPWLAVIVIGPDPKVTRRIDVTREDPVGGGPVAAILAGLERVDTRVTAVIAGDMPAAAPIALFLARELDERVADQHPGALVPRDRDGVLQPLCAAYRTQALHTAAQRLDGGAGQSMRALLEVLDVEDVILPQHLAVGLFDVDTPEDLAQADGTILRAGAPKEVPPRMEALPMLADFTQAAVSELGLDVDPDIALILDVAKDAAHGVERPAAPITTFLLGYAAASGLDPLRAAESLRSLAASWSKPEA